MYSLCRFVFIICLCISVKKCQSKENRILRFSRELKGNGCVLPQYPKFGKWSIFEETLALSSGQVVKHRTILQVSCKEHYKLDGDAVIVCINGNWTSLIGDCLKTCPSRYNTGIMTVTCRNNERKLENCENPTDGTKAEFQCADFYEDRSLDRNPIHVCYNGKWNHKYPECTPICGQKSIDEPVLILQGKNVTKGHYPWQVALYNVNTKEQICGGSLLSQRVILTAAHCITIPLNGSMNSKELYMVGVGKYYRQYDHPDDQNSAQFSSIHEMYVPRQYRGDIRSYFGDVAVLITKETFTITSRVQPVCVDWALSRFPIFLSPKKKLTGYVTGWGYTTEHKHSSHVLKELEVPIIEEEECSKNVTDDYKRFLTDDKLCAGFTNIGTSVCIGDSGGGLVVQHQTRYYVIGVVSLASKGSTESGGCDSNSYGLYTKVQYYIDNFILDKEILARPVIGGPNCDDDDPNCDTHPETPTTTTTTTEVPVTETPKSSCTLPEHPYSGRWSVYGSSSSFLPGTKVSKGTILQISCNKNYTISGSNITMCENGNWAPQIAHCLQSCPPLLSTKSTEISCSFKDNELEDCSNSLDGTIAKQKCAPFYEDLQLAKNPIRVCRNGSWDESRSDCVPICGLKSVSAQTLIVNGNSVKKGEYPWHVAIYNKRKDLICGGTLISTKLILTAALCITNLEGSKLSKDDYVVAVGKHYREYNDPLDTHSQFSKLRDMYTPVEYNGQSINFLADIAVLVSKKEFILSQYVQPVCMDWGLKYRDLFNTTGYVTGWGYTRPNSDPSQTLQDLAIPVQPQYTCLKNLPEDTLVFLTFDTFCGGYLKQNTSVCRGDGGGSFVSKHDGRYYVTGIVRLAPASDFGGCDPDQYAIYTKVSDYVSFILEIDAKVKAAGPSDTNDCLNEKDCEVPTKQHTPEPDNQKTTCTLPDHPQFGKWTVFNSGSTRYNPRFSVATGTVLQITCYKSYKLEGNSLILCQNGQWSSTIGKCLKTCPAVKSTPNMKATCISNNIETENCTEPIDGTRLKYECAPFYEDFSLRQNPINFCRDGSWSNSLPKCKPVCGQKSIHAIPLIVNGVTVAKGDYPWQVAIYTKSDKKLICSGSLLNQKVILTAAHCVTNSTGKTKPKENYIVAVGKYYRRYNDDRDRNDTQYSELQEIFIPRQYRGDIQNYHGDIAILIAVKTFVLSRRVQPVCLDISNRHKFSKNDYGFVVGWGYTRENGAPAEKLTELKVPAVEPEVCETHLPEDYQMYLTDDKFCAGSLNRGFSTCLGDSGSGLVFKDDGRYYITGIVSISPFSAARTEPSCDSQQYSLYTKVSYYIGPFILDKLVSYY